MNIFRICTSVNLYQYLIEFIILLNDAMMRLIYYANMQNKPKIKVQYRIEFKSESSTPSTVCPNTIVIIIIRISKHHPVLRQ